MASLNQNQDGKAAIVTGASSGIGKATAVHFASFGCSLCLTGRNEQELNKTKTECIQKGLKETQILIVAGDLTEESTMSRIVDETLRQFKHIHYLVNAAGIVITGNVSDNAPITQYDTVMNINVRSLVLLTQKCIPALVASQGSIVNVSSINGICSFAGVTYYCMSKAALDQFTKCLALELATKNVRVNSVNPGVIVTNVHKRAGMDDAAYEKFLSHSQTTHAMGRVGSAEEVAVSIAYLCWQATFTTGELLRIDGGRGIMTPR